MSNSRLEQTEYLNIVHSIPFTTKKGEKKNRYTVIGTCVRTSEIDKKTGAILSTKDQLIFEYQPLKEGYINIYPKKEKVENQEKQSK